MKAEGANCDSGNGNRIRRRLGATLSIAAILIAASGAWANGQTAPQPAPQAAAASAQDIAGVWQGTLTPPNAPKSTRFVVKIAKADAGGFKATLYNADQAMPPLAFDKVTLEESDIKLVTPMITIDGKLSADGKTIDGHWSSGPNAIPISLARTAPDAAWAIPEPAKAMAKDADPSLEVATIKPSQPGRPGKGFGFRGTQFMTMNTNMNDLIAFAYGMHTKQIVGAPDWFGTEMFDIDGKPDTPGRPDIKQMSIMVQKLLTDRFALKFHHEQRELSVYAVRVASGGPKMSVAGPNDMQGFGFRGLGDLIVRDMTMADFATWMQSSVMDKPVVDQTGLKDKYNFTLKWTPDDSQFAQFRGAVPPTPAPAGDNPNAPPSLYTAVQEQLGLKIEATKAMDDVIVIDHVEKPSPN